MAAHAMAATTRAALAFIVALAASACDGGGGSRAATPAPADPRSVARLWDEEALAAVRIDLPRPPVHARNLYYTSVAMWDAWAAYDDVAAPVIADESATATDREAARAIAVSYAAYRVLSHLYSLSVNASATQDALDARMAALGLDRGITSTEGSAPANVGNRIAQAVLDFAVADGANESGNYADSSYQPANDPMVVSQPGTQMNEPSRWQPLQIDFQSSQNGIPIPGAVQVFVGSHWNDVAPFALGRDDPQALYIDPGPPPQLGGAGDAEFKAGAVEVIRASAQLDASDPTVIDISPASFGNNPLGTNDGTGYVINPVTGQPYAGQPVRRADFARVLAEFWADGPQSETPPGHWNSIANYASDGLAAKRIGGSGATVNALEWDVKLYVALNGALHDAAIACWGAKRRYDSARPISQIRYMGGLGQSSLPDGPSYDPGGLPLEPGVVEVITAESSAPGERHEALADFIGEIAVFAWPGQPPDPPTQFSPARWIRAKQWLPFQRNTFVTPPFAGYFSGHSTYSRSAAEVLASITGSAYFPGGLGEYAVPANAFLQFEIGPSAPLRLQWATYYDAADQAGISRVYGGIHPRGDDFTGRVVGAQIGALAWSRATALFGGPAAP
jgi:hypothetical protein